MSIVVGLLTFLMMPASLTETGRILGGKAHWLNGKNGWWTEHEEKVLVNRLLRDDTSKGTMHNRQHVNLRGIWAAVTNVDLWPLYLVWSPLARSRLHTKCLQLGFLAFIPFQPAANYLSLTLRNLGYSVFEANMLAIPGYTLFFINVSYILE